jgi:hypothetical protein
MLRDLNYVLNYLPRVSNQFVERRIFMFPRLNLPKSILMEKNPDMFWSMSLVEKHELLLFIEVYLDKKKEHNILE